MIESDESLAKEDGVAVMSVTDRLATKMLKDLESKGNTVASKYEAKIKAKMAERRGIFLDDADEVDSSGDEEDKDLESMVSEVLSKKKSRVQVAIQDGSLTKSDGRYFYLQQVDFLLV